jgi:general secretion pathway protein A
MLYLSYYSLKEKPLQDTANPEYFWLGESQAEAISVLKFGIEKGEGITVLTGDVGTGKTVLVKYVAGLLESEFKIAKIDDPGIDSLDFLYFLADSLNLPYNFDDMMSFFEYVDEAYSKTHKRMLIIIDEAHRLTKSLFNDLVLMAKIKRDNEQLINIVLAGQDPLIKLVNETKQKGNKRKDPLVCHIRSLTKNEINEYVKHRLKIAGTESNIFTSGAIGKIFQYSCGIPRMINTICDHALMIGYSTDLKKIKTSVIKECIADLQIHNKVFDTGQDLMKKASMGKIAKQAAPRSNQKLFTWKS